ncbi:LOW QUALITY PROTEIN: hypothetical protein BRADI_3g05730v3 [Brachypodium distachyon]|uniref:FAS1 domain-containing protein n=1 Tax=Brachypodium distachyon TaxID=15368 RepID=A0A2K2CVF1_BRADI|nr:LOW QUALITY PROTEIN: hypothetical protein BRADI_3g05730v3 [Brachypodium distachyon]
MAPPPPNVKTRPFLITLAAIVLLLPAASADNAAAPFNITKILSAYPEFRVFSSLLNETGLARAIDRCKMVTILAVNNTGVPDTVLRAPRPLLFDLLALHVVLDYLDPEKLDAMRLGRTGNGSMVTTLLPGPSDKFLRVAGGDKSRITFSYAGPGGRWPRNATLIRVVTSQAFSVMVLEVSGLILPTAVPATTAARFDIIKILSSYPEFSVYSGLLRETGLASILDGRRVVTVLAPNNTDIPKVIHTLPRPLLADLLALHVIPDYLDPEKLDALRRGRTGDGSVVMTLLPGPGLRLLGIAGGENGPITFSYGGPGGEGSHKVSLVRVVTSQAFSVVVNGLVLPEGVPADVDTTSPLDITKILSSYPDLTAFNSLLTDSGLARAINARPTVTVLATNNTALADSLRGLRHLPEPALVDLLALHVVLDYLDPEKLDALRRGRTGGGSIVTTLLQESGRARGRGVGFVRVSGGEDGRITFSCSTPGGGGPRNATLVKVVTTQAFSVLVLQVSNLILPPGIVAPAPQQPRARRHMFLPPSPAPAPAPRYPPVSGVPPPVVEEPEPNLTDTAPPPSGVIPLPSAHGGVSAKIPTAAGRHRAAGIWWSGASAALGITAYLLGRL